MLLIDPPNIFRGATNDYNIKVVKYKIYSKDKIKCLIEIIEDEQGCNPMVDLKYQGRKEVEARQLFATMLINHFGLSPSKIGRKMSKNHATIYHSKDEAMKHYYTEPDYKEMFDRIEKRVKELK